LAPTWSDLANEFKGSDRVKIASVDCTKHKDVCDKVSVKGYPTLKTFYNGKEVDTYKGGRDLSSMKKYAEETAAKELDLTTE
jgi:thioredoxin domain-containing protein 5